MMETILIVDDDIWVCSNLQAYLEDEGFCVEVAESGEQALAMLKNLKPDHAIVDMRLPMMDGNEFIYRASQLNSAIRFFVHTGSVEYEMPQALRESGQVNKHIFYKPLVNMGLLLDEIRAKDAA